MVWIYSTWLSPPQSLISYGWKCRWDDQLLAGAMPLSTWNHLVLHLVLWRWVNALTVASSLLLKGMLGLCRMSLWTARCVKVTSFNNHKIYHSKALRDNAINIFYSILLIFYRNKQCRYWESKCAEDSFQSNWENVHVPAGLHCQWLCSDQ